MHKREPLITSSTNYSAHLLNIDIVCIIFPWIYLMYSLCSWFVLKNLSIGLNVTKLETDLYVWPCIVFKNKTRIKDFVQSLSWYIMEVDKMK